MIIKTVWMGCRVFFIMLIGIFSIPKPTFAQNLVPNHSFEILRNLPVKKNRNNYFKYEPKSGFIPYKVNLAFWTAASITTPDLRIHSPANYYECKRKFKNCDKPHTGENSVGIITWQVNSKVETYREYLQIKLNQALTVNDTVFVEMWVAKEREAKLVSNNIGFHFSMKRINVETKEVIGQIPQINIDTIINKSEKKWVKIGGHFIPDKPYKYLLIGNFFENDHTQVETFENFNGSPWTPPYAYYLLDDVAIWQHTPPEENLVYEGKDIALNDTIELKNIEFEFDKYDLKPESIIDIQKLLSFLNKYTQVNIEIHGHTSSEGTEEYNKNLSNERARSVYLYLIAKGIDENRLSYQGFGESIPKVQNTSEDNRQQNRRVEFIIK